MIIKTAHTTEFGRLRRFGSAHFDILEKSDEENNGP
jgi:hypothetical protein